MPVVRKTFLLTCFVTYRNKTISAVNLSGGLFAKNSRSYAHYHHAESRAIRKALSMGFDPSECHIHVVRDLRGGGVGCAKPCGRCMKLLLQLGVKKSRIHWSDG